MDDSLFLAFDRTSSRSRPIFWEHEHSQTDWTMKQARHELAPLMRAITVAGLIALKAVAAASASAGEPPVGDSSTFERQATDLATESVDLAAECARLEAGNTFLEEELRRLQTLTESDSAGQELILGLARVDAEMRRTLGDVLQENADVLISDVQDSLADMRAMESEARAAWIETRTTRIRTELVLWEVRASGRIAGQLASLLSVDKRWFWLCGLIAIATLFAVVCHDRRHEIRKMLNGGRPKAMGLSRVLAVLIVFLACATVVTFLMGDRIYAAMLAAGTGDEESTKQLIEKETAALKAKSTELSASRESFDEARSDLVKSIQQRLVEGLPARNRLPDRWQELREAMLSACETVAVLNVVGEGLRADQADLKQTGKILRSEEAATRWYLLIRRWIRGILGTVLLGLSAAGGAWYCAGVSRRRRQTADTCPLCLGRGALNSQQEAEEGAKDLQIVQCHNVISQEPYEQCDFSFKEAYRSMPKLCFPTLGIPQAGKTHWLAMLYWSLNQGNYPKTVEFERVRSQTSEDFDRIVEEILIARIGTAATQQDRIPHPLIFNFRDRDPLGRSNPLVNIFDYSGEVTSEMDATDYRRRRALDGDGFLFFLDPTYPSEVQAKALADFREDLRLLKGVKAGRRLRVPVALCISKIDLLAGHDIRLEDGSDAIVKFYEDLSRIDPTGESTKQSILEERSRLTSELREVIWPDWQIERQIEDLFGGRFAFFPLTPVGLDGRGEADLSLRTISPFGLIEPLLWLLQMTGHPVLQK